MILGLIDDKNSVCVPKDQRQDDGAALPGG